MSTTTIDQQSAGNWYQQNVFFSFFPLHTLISHVLRPPQCRKCSLTAWHIQKGGCFNLSMGNWITVITTPMRSYLFVFEQLCPFCLIHPSLVKKAPLLPASMQFKHITINCFVPRRGKGGLYLQHRDASVASLGLISNITHRFPHKLSFSNH